MDADWWLAFPAFVVVGISRVMGWVAVQIWFFGRHPDEFDVNASRNGPGRGSVAYRRVWRLGQVIGWASLAGLALVLVYLATVTRSAI